MADDLELPPPTPEAVDRVRGELRSEWWKATLITGAPVVIATGLAYLTVRGLVGGDWFSLLFPGIPAVLLGLIGLRLLLLAVMVSRRERGMDDVERDRAVYARGLSGTHQLAAAQDPSGLAALKGLWPASWAEVVSVQRQSAVSPRVHADVRVRLEEDVERTALLIAPKAAIPAAGDRVVALMDPHHDRGVIDLRHATKVAMEKGER